MLNGPKFADISCTRVTVKFDEMWSVKKELCPDSHVAETSLQGGQFLPIGSYMPRALLSEMLGINACIEQRHASVISVAMQFEHGIQGHSS